MGALAIVWFINTLALAKRTDKRAAVRAFVISSVVCITLASFGFADESITPLQQLPFMALDYGKFSLALLVIDLYNAKKIAEDPGYLQSKGRFGFPPSPAWALALIVVTIGAGLSFLLPQPQP